MSFFAKTANELAESGIVPDSVIRLAIRRLVAERQSQVRAMNGADLDSFVNMMKSSPIALVPELANEQHYEVPAEFFEQVLGTHRKYSCCYWDMNTVSLDMAEQHSLQITCERAGIRDGQEILDLGCGWGSLSLWIARQYPSSRVLSVSNSASQKAFIDKEAASLGLSNIEVRTADMNDFSTDRRFDRIVSIEMFEHMRNYEELFRRVSEWLQDDGRFFMHIFCHRSAAYEFVDAGPWDWMSRHFFSGGIMPAGDLPARFQKDLTLEEQWRWDGRQYQRTAEAWLRNMDQRRGDIMPILAEAYGRDNARRWWMRWRIFFLAVSEMFGAEDGRVWGVGHYLFRPRAGAST